MAKALIIYGSETGNTMAAAKMVAQALENKDIQVAVQDVVESTVQDLDQPYDLYLLGVSTWGAVEDEVQEDFKEFYADMASTSLKGKKMAVFGCGDSGYANFCKAVDYVAKRAKEQGAELVADSLKIDLDPRNSREMIKTWADQVGSIVV
ncbi:MAG: flavodoxin [Desulfovibrionales bacterium]